MKELTSIFSEAGPKRESIVCASPAFIMITGNDRSYSYHVICDIIVSLIYKGESRDKDPHYKPHYYTRSFKFSMRSLEIIVSLSLAFGVSGLAAPVNQRSRLNTVCYSLYFYKFYLIANRRAHPISRRL